MDLAIVAACRSLAMIETRYMLTHEPALAALFERRRSLTMCAYDKVQGVHNCANRNLLTTTLREEWGFDGHVILTVVRWCDG